MKPLFIFLFACWFNQVTTAQVETSRKQLPQKEVSEGQSSKKQIQAGMISAINEMNTQITEMENQLAEAIRNKEEEESELTPATFLGATARDCPNREKKIIKQEK